VKPDWYLLWIYGFLKIVPTWTEFRFLGATFSPNFFGGLLFPTLVFGLMTFAPWIDRTNRKVAGRFEYLEPPRQTPFRLSLGIAMLSMIGTLFLAAYYDELGMSLGEIWAVVIAVPIVVGVAVYLWSRRWAKMMRFEPRTDPVTDSMEERQRRERLSTAVGSLRGRELELALDYVDTLKRHAAPPAQAVNDDSG
jgi:quinol-cytochrome oxidoreductase complex cytochrome b subunit